MSGGLTRFLGTQDMTVGSPIKKLIQFSIPLLLGNLAQQMYNTVDSIVVGRYVGDNALAAVGASGPMLNLLLVLFIGISTGANVMVAQYFGAKQREQLSKAVGTTITLTFLPRWSSWWWGRCWCPHFWSWWARRRKFLNGQPTI